MSDNLFQVHELPTEADVIAPDGSEIRLLPAVEGASMVHCTLPSKQITKPIYHRTVDEIWYCLSGRGSVWLKKEVDETVVDFTPGTSLCIPVGTHFQFRNDSDAPLEFIIATIPPWSGEEEAVLLHKGKWTVSD